MNETARARIRELRHELAEPLAAGELVDVLLDVRTSCDDDIAVAMVDRTLSGLRHRVRLGVREAVTTLDRLDASLLRRGTARRGWRRPSNPPPRPPVDA
jgi:hypothetical protein